MHRHTDIAPRPSPSTTAWDRARSTPDEHGRVGRPPSSYLTTAQWDSIAAALPLSRRQLQIVRCIFDGLDERSMSRQLGIATGTIHTYLDRLYKKLGVRCRCELIVLVFVVYLVHE